MAFIDTTNPVDSQVLPKAPVLPLPMFGVQPPQPLALPLPQMPTQAQANVNELNRLVSTGSGVSQIHNPFGRTLARIGDIALQTAGAVVPALHVVDALTPGTTAHHNMLVHQQAGLVANDQAQAQAAAQTAGQQASTEHVKAETEALQNPLDKFTPIATDSGYASYDPKTGTASPVLAPDGSQLATPEKTKAAPTLQQLHASAVADAMSRGVDPAVDPKVQQYADSITSLQRQPNPKEPNKDDKYIAINAKIAAGQPLTPDEQSFKQGYEHYVKVNKIDPAAVRMSAMLQMPQAIVDPNDPSKLVYSTRKNAVGQEAPGSGDAQAARRMDTYMTSGAGGQALATFNTTQYHLQTLAKAAQALQNGNTTVFNQIAQEYAQQTGSAVPTNFDAVKLAVRGEVARALAGHSTVAEQSDLDKNFSRASSPAQLAGIASTYHELLQGKKNALQSQYVSGTQGKPDFNGAPPQSGMAVSLKDAMNLPQNKGKSEADVRADIQSHGHAVRP